MERERGEAVIQVDNDNLSKEEANPPCTSLRSKMASGKETIGISSVCLARSRGQRRPCETRTVLPS